MFSLTGIHSTNRFPLKKSRIKENDETIIKFRLIIESIPLGQSTSSWYVVMFPTDKRIKELIFPVVCYRSISRKDSISDARTRPEKEDVPKLLKPERISLGVIPGDEVREFELAGSSELIHSLKITSFEGFPVDSTVELRLGTDVEIGRAHV